MSICGNMTSFQILQGYLFLNKMMVNLYMLCSSLENRINREVKSTHIVTSIAQEQMH